MNFYATNVAPLNGYEVQFAAGAGAIEMAGAGQAFPVQQGEADATIAVAATGSAIKASLGRGHAPIALDMTGTMVAVQFGHGEAAIPLTGSAKGTVAIQADASAAITLGGLYAIPRPLQVPSVYRAAPLARLLMEAADPRLIQVPPEPILRVRENRTATIQPERRQA